MSAVVTPPAYRLFIGGFAEFSALAYGASRKAGWYSHPNGTPKERNHGEMIALMHSELSEAWDGFQRDAQDDHLPNRRNVEVELADYLIRVGDFAGFVELGAGIDAAIYQLGMKSPLSGYALMSTQRVFNTLHKHTSDALEGVRKGTRTMTALAFANAIHLTKYLAPIVNAHDLPGAIEEKMAYNAVRADHKLEVRNAGGKQF